MKKENNSAELSQSDVKDTSDIPKSPSQNAPDYEILKAHYLEREETEKELIAKEDLLAVDSNELGTLKNVTPSNRPNRSWFSLDGIMAAGIVIGILAALFLVFLCIVWNRWYSIQLVMWVFLVLFVTADALFIAYFIQRNKFNEALEIFPKLLARKKELEDSVVALTSSIKRLKEQNIASLYSDVKEYCDVPLPGLSVNEKSYEYWTNIMYDFMVLKEKLNNEKNQNKHNELYKALADKKLEVFYDISMKEEASGSNSYQSFKTQLHSARKSEDFNLLRLNNDEFESKHSEYITSLSSELSADVMSPLLDELNEIKDIDTDNFLGITSVDKLEEKTEKIKDVYSEVLSTYNDFNKITEQINLILEYVRLCAYRNIYLGVEIINYIRANAGGGSLTTEKGKLKLETIEANVKMPIETKVNFMDNISDSFGAFGEWMFSSKEAFNFSMDNPGLAIGTVAVSAVVNYFGERKDKIDKLNRSSKKMIENISEMAEGYTSGKASISRATEIIKAIVKANKGFMQIYSPLREKVFEKGDISSVTMTDIQQIAKATNEYNKIASSKL